MIINYENYTLQRPQFVNICNVKSEMNIMYLNKGIWELFV